MITKPIVKNNLHFVRKKKEKGLAFYLIRRDRQDSTLSRGSWRRLARRDSSRKMLTSRDTNTSRSIKTIGKKEMVISLLIMKTSGRESTTMNLLVSKLLEPVSWTMKQLEERLSRRRWPRSMMNCKDFSNRLWTLRKESDNSRLRPNKKSTKKTWIGSKKSKMKSPDKIR